MGRFYCFGAECCEDNGLPDLRYNLPLLVYDTDKHGNIVGADFDTRYLSLPDKRYTPLVALHNNVPLDTIDFLCTCENEEWQRYGLQNVGPAAWRSNEQFAQLVANKVAEVWPFTAMVIGQTLSREDYLKKKAEGQQQVSGAALGTPQANLSAFLKG